MADKVSIAIRQEQAFTRLEAAMQTLAEQLGVEAVEIPRQGSNPELLRAQQTEALANWAEGVAVMLTPSAKVGSFTPYADLTTHADLDALLTERGIDPASIVGTGTGGNVLVGDKRAALAADDAAKAKGELDAADGQKSEA